MKADRHPRLVSWWTDDPRDPDRPLADNPDVLGLVEQIAPGSSVRDLGGAMSLNLLLDPAGLMLRVHQPFVSRNRLLALQQVRTCLADAGLTVPVALCRLDTSLFRCRNRWAELESFIPHIQRPPSLDLYQWLFEQIGILHCGLASIAVTLPRPLVATFATPRSLRRWLTVTEATVERDPGAARLAARVRNLVRRLERGWIRTAELPVQLVHGDASPRNICRAADGTTVYVDFGFSAVRPRVHDLAYAIVVMVHATDGARSPESFAWDVIPRLLAAYSEAALTHLLPNERSALCPCAVAVLLYHAALDGFTADPPAMLRSRVSQIRLGEWLLDRPSVLKGIKERMILYDIVQDWLTR